MYKLSIPVSPYFTEQRREQTFEELARAKADRVFITQPHCLSTEEAKRNSLEFLRREIPVLREKGYEVGVWINAFGHGGDSDLDPAFQRIIPSNGRISTDSICPLDEQFAKKYRGWIAELAATGPDLIMIDDDYRLGYRRGLVGCFCPLHLARVSALLGEEMDRETLSAKALSGKPNKYRDVWMQVNRDSLLDFARSLRSAVDSVNPSVRLGHCAVLDTWDIDGVDSIELAKTFAGGTKPFLRLIGAAYWANKSFFGCNMANVIELERMQASWCENEGIEIFSEGDVFPRPRHTVPAAHLEALDTALRADGHLDGILKYMIDYSCTPFYERGYIDRHERHLPLYKEISRLFDNKKPCGVRVYDCMHRLKDAVLPEPFVDDKYVGKDFAPASARMLCDNAIPMQYTEPDVTVIFGENARHAPAEMLDCGAVLDAPAARILTERGFDVGLSSIGASRLATAVFYPEAGQTFTFRSGMYDNDGMPFPTFNMKPGAESIFHFCGPKGDIPAYRYENANGQRFLLFPFEAKLVREVSMLFRNYATQEMLIRQLAWIRRRPLDACLTKSPDAYLLTKRNENSLALGVWNFSLDSIYEPTIPLGEEWVSAEFVNCTGTLQGDRLTLSDIAPYGMAFILLKK